MEVRIPLAGPPAIPDVKVQWTRNPSVRRQRVSGLVGLALSLGLLALAFDSFRAGDASLLPWLVLILAFYLTDTALERLAASAQAPREVGISSYGAHFRTPRGEFAFAWDEIRDVRHGGFGRRVEYLRVALRSGQTRTLPGVPLALSNEVKLAWLEESARRTQAHRPAERTALRPAVPGAPQGAPPGATRGAQVIIAIDRPEWTFTRTEGGQSMPDPLFSSGLSSPRPFVWHFVPASGSRTGAAFLVAVLLLSGVAVSRLIADLLVSVARVQADPWLATGIGLAAGAALAALAWRAARQELTGEVAGSVLFLPAFDRTKAELITSLKEAAAGEGVGRPRERSGRRRTVLVWARAKTRATVLRSSYDTRAIVLRTIGSPNFAVHARLKGAILDRLDPGRRK